MLFGVLDNILALAFVRDEQHVRQQEQVCLHRLQIATQHRSTAWSVEMNKVRVWTCVVSYLSMSSLPSNTSRRTGSAAKSRSISFRPIHEATDVSRTSRLQTTGNLRALSAALTSSLISLANRCKEDRQNEECAEKGKHNRKKKKREKKRKKKTTTCLHRQQQWLVGRVLAL